MRYGGSNPPLCTISFVVGCEWFVVSGVDLSPASSGRMWIALALLGLLAVAVWQTMEPGKLQQLTWVLLGFFAFRVILGRLRSR
jgi:hypothetical protein